MSSTINFGPTQHGVAGSDFPGPIQKKMATSDAAGGSLPPILYDMPNAVGNVLVAICSGPSGSSPTISSTNEGTNWTAAAAQTAIDEAQTIPSSGPYTVTVANASSFIDVISVVYASTGALFGPLGAGGTPIAGQYQVSGGVFTFSSADAGQAILITYSYSSGGQVWYTIAVGGPNTVTISGAGAPSVAAIMEIPITNGTVVPGGQSGKWGSPGTIALIKSGAGVFGPDTISATFRRFLVDTTGPYAMPGDAVITGIYPVAIGSYAGDAFHSSGWNVDGGSSGSFPFTWPSATYYTAATGATLTHLASNNTTFGFSVLATNSGNGCNIFGAIAPWGASGGYSMQIPGFAVYYTSATPAIDPWQTPPFAVPPGSGLAWAKPQSATINLPPLFELAGGPYMGLGSHCYGSFNVHRAGGGSGTPGDWTFSAPNGGTVELGAEIGSSASANQAAGQPAFLLAIPFYASATDSSPVVQWKEETPSNTYANSPSSFQVYSRVVNNPGAFNFQPPGSAASITFLSINKPQPTTDPASFGDFMDLDSMEQTRLQCRANGLWGSLNMTAQKSAREWIQDCVTAANVFPVMSGHKLKLVPRSEVSAAGNGAVYVAPTASGPEANLDVDKGDFICEKGESPIVVKRAARQDLNTVVQMQHFNRGSDYQQVVTTVSDAASILKYGIRKEDPQTNLAIQDVNIARMILGIEVRRKNYIEPLKYSFRLPARWQLLEPPDLITITDRLQGIIAVPVRLTSANEDDKYGLVCEAEPFFYGLHSPLAASVDTPTPYSPDRTQSAGNVNAPVIFEPVPRLYSAQNQQQLWLAVSCANANYGGCQVFISTDGGLSYNLAGDPLVGSAITGVSTADWPAATSPDTTNDLALNLTESNGELASYQTSDEDNFLYPCYIAGGGAYSIPYELMTYAVATLTGTNLYTLKATGSGNHLDRGVFGAPALGVGVDHPSGSRFALLDPSGTGILKLTMDPTWIGKTLYFKILSFNTFGGALQSLSSVTAYSYTPTGAPGSVNSTGIPAQGFQVNGA